MNIVLIFLCRMVIVVWLCSGSNSAYIKHFLQEKKKVAIILERLQNDMKWLQNDLAWLQNN